MQKKLSFLFTALFLVINITYLFAGEITIKPKETHQTMIGLGASVAWADDQLASHPKSDEIYNLIFNELGLDILRLRNTYRSSSISNGNSISRIVSSMNTIAEEKPAILISSWSPPVNLKSNNSTENGGTLKKDSAGKYLYGDFAKYWTDAITAYNSIGVVPDYISIQNEPDYTATWESCRFEPAETTNTAGYNKALDTVYTAIQNAGLQVNIIGPESIGIGYNAFQNFVNRLNKSHLNGYAYHLYHGESDNVSDNHNPDLFINNLRNIANNYTGKPIFVTEYDRGDWFNTVWLINNCIVLGNVSAYLWWELVWGSGGKPLIQMQSNNYTITKYFWAFKHFSKYISSGWKRVTAVSDSGNVKTSAFINPEGNKLTVVVINTGTQTQTKNLDIREFATNSGTVFRTTDVLDCSVIDSIYDGKSALDFPPRSITTISLSGNLITTVEKDPLTPYIFSVSQNYPNPFNPSTSISYQIPTPGFVSLKVYNIPGNEIASLVNEFKQAGKYEVSFNALNLSSGIYFYELNAGAFKQAKKMLLLK